MLIDAFAATWLETLDKWAESLPIKENLYLLLDTAFVVGMHRPLAMSVAQTEVPRLLFESLPGCSEAVRDVSPLLLRYSGQSSKNLQLQKVLLRCNGWPMVHAIRTPENLQTLGQRLEQWCVVDADGQRFNFRYPDTRRLPGIFANLSIEQRGHFVGPASAWHIVGRNGRWQQLPGVPHVPPKKALDTRLTAAQFGAMVADGEADGILTILADRGGLWQQLHSASYDTVAQALHAADRHPHQPNTQAPMDEGIRVDWCEACLNDPRLLQSGDSLENLQHWLTTQPL
ncbi:MAG: DUF4123 domain-containing protein [Burkholderiales bacterium]|nr:DUF4123 domain-containing protein [Burkholderiales bacterium]